MTKSIQSRLESLETAMPPSYRPPEGFGVLGLVHHLDALPPSEHDACIQSLTEDELDRIAEELRQMLGAETIDQCKDILRESIATDELKEQRNEQINIYARRVAGDRHPWEPPTT